MELFIAALVTGLVTSFHCVAMCGSLVLTYAVKDETSGPWYRRMLPHLAYQGAKLVSYVTVGLLLGSIGLLLGLDAGLGGFRGYFTVVAAALMVLIGVQMTGRFPALNRFMPRPPKALMDAISRTRRKARSEAAQGKVSLVTPITFGLLTGLMPCSPLMAQQAAAAASGSPLSGATIMLGFGLGTVPLMLGFGTVAGALSHRAKSVMNTVAAVVIIVFGLVMLNRGLMLVGSPVTAQSVAAALTGRSAVPSQGGFTEAADGVAEVRLVIEDTRFVPDTVRIPSDRPVRLIVDRREASACSDQLAVPQLGVLADLAPNAVTVVDLPAAKDGSYTLTCGMGMMSGTLVAAAGDTGAAAPAVTAASATQASVAGTGTACACCGTGAPAGTATTGTATVTGGVQHIFVDVTKGYYDPETIVLAAGVPAEVTFSASSGCTSQVISEDLGFSEDLTTGPKTVKLPALEPGEYGFSCGMRMVFGTILVK